MSVQSRGTCDACNLVFSATPDGSVIHNSYRLTYTSNVFGLLESKEGAATEPRKWLIPTSTTSDIEHYLLGDAPDVYERFDTAIHNIIAKSQAVFEQTVESVCDDVHIDDITSWFEFSIAHETLEVCITIVFPTNTPAPEWPSHGNGFFEYRQLVLRLA